MDKELEIASGLYGIDRSELNLIKSYSNFIFETKNKILQLTRSKYKTKEELSIELNWIEYLNRSDFEVVKIVKSRNNNLFEQVGDFTIICYEKIIGKKASKSDWNESFFNKLGRFTGRLHRLGKSFEIAGNYKPVDWDKIPKGRFVAYLPIDNRELEELYEKLISEFKGYVINEENYGLIHYDIHYGNYYLTGSNNKIILFDFEMTCKSWYINDVSVILYYILNSIQLEDQKDLIELFLESFFKGYREEFFIEEKEKKKIPKFLLYRDLLVYAYTFRIWKEEKNMTKNEHKFRKKLSDSIDRRRTELHL